MKVSFFLSYLLLLLSSCFFCGNLNAASVGTLTVKFGQTTEDTFKATHPYAVKVGVNPEQGGNIYKEMPNDNENVNRDVVHQDLKSVFVWFDQNRNLIALHLQFKNDGFSILSKLMEKKHRTKVKDQTFYGGNYHELYHDGVSIYLTTAFFFSETSLLYIKTDVKDKILKSIPKDKLEEPREMLNAILERSFPSME